MLRFAIAFLCIVPALAERAVVEVVRVEDVVPVLSALLNAAHIDLSRADLAAFLPKGNLQGTIANGLNRVAGAIRAPEQVVDSVIKEMEVVPIVGTHVNTLQQQLHDPVIPTLPPSELPPELGRAVANLGIITASEQNPAAAIVSLPTQLVANGATKVSNIFATRSNQVLGIPSQINQLLQFQNSLWQTYLAGMLEAGNAVPAQALQDELLSLIKMQPNLSPLLGHITNPTASGVFTALANAFTSMTGMRMGEGVAEGSLFEPQAMKVALAEVAMNFVNFITKLEGASE